MGREICAEHMDRLGRNSLLKKKSHKRIRRGGTYIVQLFRHFGKRNRDLGFISYANSQPGLGQTSRDLSSSIARSFDKGQDMVQIIVQWKNSRMKE